MSCYKHLWTMILIIISNLAYASNIAWYAHDGQFHKLSGQINQAVWIDKDNVKLITRPDQNAESIPNNLKMRQRFYVVHQNFNIDYKGKHWMLLADYDQTGPQAHKLIGWIAHEDVLLNYTPLQSNSDFLQKVVLREGDVSNHQQANDVSVYHDPKLHGSSERLPIRTIFYVYKYAPKNGPIEDATSLLISPAPYLETTKESETLIAGWIARDKVTFWNTRSAIEFKPGYTYQLTLKTGEVLPLILDRALQHHEFRYPLLKSEKDSYTVGVFSTQSLQDLLPTFNLGLEVMFVIDATRSMQMGIDAVLKATQQIAKKIRRQSKETGLIAPKFGVVFYRDKATSYRSYGPGKQYKYCRHEVSMPQALTADISAFKDALRSQKACDANETPSESMYKGLKYATQKAGWKKRSKGKQNGIRMIIHVGDAGDHLNGPTAYDVAQIFTQNHISIYTALAIQNFSFTSSIKAIRQHLSFDQIDVEILETNPNTLLSELKISLQAGYEEARILNLTFSAEHSALPSLPTIENTLVRLHFGKIPKSVLKLAKSASRNNHHQYKPYQRYWEGTIRKEGTEKRLLISRGDLEALLPPLTDMINFSDNVEKRRDIWNQFVTLVTGDSFCEDQFLTAKDCSAKRNGIPITAKFMDYTREEFVNLPSADINKIICEAQVLRSLIRHMMSNKKILDIKWLSRENCDFKLNTTRDLNGDGKIVEKGMGNANYPEDVFFFSKSNQIEMIWFPADALRVD